MPSEGSRGFESRLVRHFLVNQVLILLVSPFFSLFTAARLEQ